MVQGLGFVRVCSFFSSLCPSVQQGAPARVSAVAGLRIGFGIFLFIASHCENSRKSTHSEREDPATPYDTLLHKRPLEANKTFAFEPL